MPQARSAIASKYDVLTFGFDPARTGKNTAESTLGVSNVSRLRQVWTTGFATVGAFDATPVGASNVATPSGLHDLIYVGNEGGGFGAIDANTGAVVWQTTVGQTVVPCGDFPGGHAGVTGAAVIDRAANRVYVAGGAGWLYGFDMGTGQRVAHWQITHFPAYKHVYGALQLDPARHKVYVPIAGMCDRNPYQGQVEGFNTATGARTLFTVMQGGQNGGGIWGWGGASMDSNGNLFVATGNANPWGASEANLYAERIIKLAASSLAILSSNHPGLGGGQDMDFGATPTLMNVAGCSPRLAANNKNGHQYIYARNNLAAGPTENLTVTSVGAYGGFFQGLPAFDPATGMMFTTVPQDGPVYKHGIMARRFGSDCRTHPAWAKTTGPTSSPVSSPTLANGVVYYADGMGETLHAFKASDGTPLWTSAPGDFNGAIFSAPTVFNGRLYASSRGGTLHAFG